MEHFLYKRVFNKEAKINLCFAYPAIESFAMASLGYLAIFKIFDCDSEIMAQRLYLDSETEKINIKNIDYFGFSVSFELDILNIIKMLKKYGIPLKSSERKDSDPLVFAGGPVLISNPIPYEDFFDFISIGEKACMKNAFNILKEYAGFPKDEILKKLSDVDGIYVPKYKKEKVNVTRDDLKNEIIYTPIISDKSFFKDTFVIEIERGCPKMCKFCSASWMNLPVRFVPYEKIINAIDLGLKYTNKLALLGAYVAGHPNFSEIIDYIDKKADNTDIELSVSSIRADLADDKLIKTLVKCSQKSATIALEAGSQRLRNYINKDLTEEQIINTVNAAHKNGLKSLKIYVMVGLPTETDEDIEELINLAKKIKNNIKQNQKEFLLNNFEIIFSASTFVPKPHTPFENENRFDKNILEKRLNYLKKELHKTGVDFRSPSIDWDIIQSILSRYNASLADFLIGVNERGGNIGAFKQIWREYSKKGILPPFEQSAKNPLYNIKTPEWDFVNFKAP